MHYRQLLEEFSELAHWSFSDYSGDNTNVFDSFDNSRILVNNGATLGEEGNLNQQW
jgi:hypothetical protein